MADFKLVAAPEATTLAGRAAGHASMSYTLKAAGSVFPARSEMWVIPRGDHFVIIGVGFRQDEKTGSRTELLKIVESITLAD